MPTTCSACGQPLPPAAEAALPLSVSSVGSSAFVTGAPPSLPHPQGPINLRFDVTIETLANTDRRADLDLISTVAEAVQQAAMLAASRAGRRTLEIVWSA